MELSPRKTYPTDVRDDEGAFVALPVAAIMRLLIVDIDRRLDGVPPHDAAVWPVPSKRQQP